MNLLFSSYNIFISEWLLRSNNNSTRCLSLQRIIFLHIIVLQLESQLAPCSLVNLSLINDRLIHLQSPQDIGSYLAGFFSDMQDGTTPSTQLKLRPKFVIHISIIKRVDTVLTKEKGHRYPLRSTPIINPMHCTLIYIIAKPHHEISNVNHDRALHGDSFNPLSLTIQHLQAASHILPQ